MSLLTAGPLNALAPNARHRLEHGSLEILIVRVADEVFAIEDRCSHGDVPLSEGELDGCLIECWLHGSTFDLRTGIPTCPPAVSPIRTFPVSINDHDGTPTVFVEIG
jgi:3-phenylpropionate/trans-cinnamate dioxygenase ferredoxin subunit